MPLLTLANVGHAYGTHVVLDGATLSVEPGEKIGLVGRNGSGKTTLMRVMVGELTPDSGSLQLQRGGRVGYLRQSPNLPAGESVRDIAESAFEKLHALHVEMTEVCEAMASAEGAKLDGLLRRQARLEGAIEVEGGYAIDHRIDAMLHGLGFTDDQFDLTAEKLSGGQKGRLGLVRLLLERPDLLLLDEPTNHLDIDGRRWLETFLAEDYSGAVVIVSHDRWLLDRVVERIVEVDFGVVREYPGNYHSYVELRRERHLTRRRVHDKQKDRIRQEEQFIRRYKTGQRARQARGRQSRLDRFKRDELVDRPLELDIMRLSLPPAGRSGDQVLTAEGLAKRYGDLTLFEDFDLSVRRGDRIGIIGPNGVGKTTLIKCLMGELEPDEGETRRGTRVNVGYYRQLHENLDLSLTVWQYLQSVIVGLDGQARASEQQARDLAGAFLFSGDEQDKLLADVSGGERSRAVLAGLVAGSHNLLVLDEPTNHLDLPSSERLEQALSRDGGYTGTLIIITHDRALLESTCDELIIFDGSGAVRLFHGHYTDWGRRDAAQQGEAAAGVERVPRKPAAKRKPPSKPKDPMARISLKDLEAKIEAIDARGRVIDEQMLDPAIYTDGEKLKTLKAERAALQKELEPLEVEWSRRVEAG